MNFNFKMGKNSRSGLSGEKLKSHLKFNVITFLNDMIKKKLSFSFKNKTYNIPLTNSLKYILESEFISVNLNSTNNIYSDTYMNVSKFIKKMIKNLKEISIKFFEFHLKEGYIDSIGNFLTEFSEILSLKIFLQSCLGKEITIRNLSKSLNSLKYLQEMYIDISFNRLRDEFFLSNLSPVFNIIQLKKLGINLAYNNLTDILYLSNGLSNLKDLNNLYLNLEGISSIVNIDILINTISFLSNLNTLQLTLESCDLISLFKCFSNLLNLINFSLNIRKNILEDIYLNTDILKLTKLKHLKLNLLFCLKFNLEGDKNLCPIDLRHLELSRIYYISKIIMPNYEEFINVNKLTHLTISILPNIKNSEEIFNLIINLIKKVINLTFLKMNIDCLFSQNKQSLVAIINSFIYLKNLRHLNLSLDSNKLDKEIHYIMLIITSHLNWIYNLDISFKNNNIFYLYSEDINMNLCLLNKLEKLKLNIEGNKIGEKCLRRLCEELCTLPKLSVCCIKIKLNKINNEDILDLIKSFKNIEIIH